MVRSRSWYGVLAAAVLGVAAVVCTSLLTAGAVRVKNTDEQIRVTGSARKFIKSDLIVWGGTIRCRANSSAAAYKGLKSGLEQVRSYLQRQGLPETEVSDTPIETRALYEPLPKDLQSSYGSENVLRQVAAYELSQGIQVRSNKVELVDKVSRGVTELISSGVIFDSEAPEYLYTKLGELKVEILAEAAKDARVRADQMAKNAGCQLGPVRYARMGVMRITPAYATVELDEFGTYDTSTVDKEITAVVTAGFAIR
ncbi:MAG: SIMPL domain-containing protein [Fimbriimonadaceae bacterium]|nr:SIMPL domain-containing protein [Fimbriimonadaceae bacterium]